MTFRIEPDDDVAVLTLDRPPVNALDLETVLALERAAGELASSDVKGLVLTGAGKLFSAGVDTRAFAGYAAADREAMVLGITRMIGALYTLPFPVVSATVGHAMGGGFVLMLAADVRIASDDDDARLGLQEARAGIPFPAGPLEIIRSELSPELLRRLTLTSVPLSPRELHALGVIDQLVPAEAIVQAAVGQVRSLSEQPAFRLVKQQIRRPTAERIEALVRSGQDPLLAHLEHR
jgi:enoyl-CoA hydratase